MTTRNTIHCEWCGREVPQSTRGRRRKYCDQACRQRAYEHRHAGRGAAPGAGAGIAAETGAGAAGGAPRGVVARDVGKLRDGLFELRCAAEDIQTAVSEGADAADLHELCTELVKKAREIEHMA